MIEISRVLLLNLHFQIVDQVSRSEGKSVQYNLIKLNSETEIKPYSSGVKTSSARAHN